MNNSFETLDGLRGMVWATLAQGVSDASHPARFPVLATVDARGWPQARTVVLRSADADLGLITVHTDLYSAKVAELQNSPRAALHIWDAGQSLQIRLLADVEIRSGAEVADIWAKTPDHMRQSYGVTPPPGHPIAKALDYVKSPDPATFAQLRLQVRAVDAVHLGENHRRASFTQAGDWASDWAGQWLAP